MFCTVDLCANVKCALGSGGVPEECSESGSRRTNKCSANNTETLFEDREVTQRERIFQTERNTQPGQRAHQHSHLEREA